MKRSIFLLVVLLVSILLVVSGCKKDETTGPSGSTGNTDIPADPGGQAPTPVINNVAPSGSITKASGNPYRIQINMLGIIDPTTGQPITLSVSKSSAFNPTAANIFVTEDTTLQGIKITAAGGGTTLLADVVFVVDNSGSMGEEADSIASKIIAFSNFLASRGLNVRVGCVGYEYGDVNGARNLTDPASLAAYLNRQYQTGTSRTMGTGGPDSARLATAITTFPRVSAENATLGVWFADSLFTWRSGAQRIYVNFTDESLQTGNSALWSVAGLRARWNPNKGSIHTVFSIDDYYWTGNVPDTTRDTYNGYNWTHGQYERPWSLSSFSGGTVKFVHSSGVDLDLTTLPVTGALGSSYLVEFVTANPSVPHNVTITVKTATADGKTVFQNIAY